MKKNRKQSENYTNNQDERIETWEQIRLELERLFDIRGVTICEICHKSTFGLAFAHALKRKDRRMSPPKDLFDNASWSTYYYNWRRVARLCSPCHKLAEDRGNKNNEMMDIIDAKIKERGWWQ